VYELIPYVEQKFRLNGFRFVTGHSSGGWSSLWLQSHYPNAFHGCWSSSPDAIDFRNFEGVNLYTDANVFYDAKGRLLPGMTVGGRNFINYKKDVCAWERIVRSEQYMSFNAVFSGRKADGSIDYLWDFTTGAINPAQRVQWRKYDIAHHLVSNWNMLREKLAHKILITTGDADNWALEKAVLLLKKDAEEKKMEIAIQILSGDHFTVFTSDRAKYGAQHTKQCYEKWSSR
jgi:S-formylglutathione hydrolase FrmB